MRACSLGPRPSGPPAPSLDSDRPPDYPLGKSLEFYEMAARESTPRIFCIRCRRVRWEGTDCPHCAPDEDVATAASEDEPAPPSRKVHWRELVEVYEAPHEIAAISIQAILQAESIHAVIRSSHVPGYAGVAMTLRGCWGWVLVPEEDAPRARSTITAYLQSLGIGGDHPSLPH
ncbi:MAG: hypothetical protein GF355_07140 [Candidatus Eisenbacteria bacterium]|nr:hypothetical protein [Candidatus Eisenbacteria bacterium]